MLISVILFQCYTFSKILMKSQHLGEKMDFETRILITSTFFFNWRTRITSCVKLYLGEKMILVQFLAYVPPPCPQVGVEPRMLHCP